MVFFRVLANGKGVKGGDTIEVKHNTYELKKLKFYITNFKAYSNQKVVVAYKEAFLLDFTQQNQEKILFPKKVAFDSISFTLGIDSATNCSGAYGGDLDPTKGMYWSWQSGYINFKLEAKPIISKADLVYHLGGYRKGELCTQNIGLKMPSCDYCVVEMDLEKVLFHFLDSGSDKLMSPGSQTQKLSKTVGESFNANCL